MSGAAPKGGPPLASADRLPLRRLMAASLAVLAVVVASTAILYVQLRKSADDALLGRGLDRAAGVALAARSATADDGVVAHLAHDLVDATVLHAVALHSSGATIGDGQLAGVEPGRAALMAATVLRDHTWRTHIEYGLLGAERFELWFPLKMGQASQPTEALRPGPLDSGDRVLLLVLDPASERKTLTPALVHAAVIIALLGVLLALTVRQLRQEAALRRQAEARSSELRFLELGRLSAVLAHEIRNPLGAIKGFAQLTAPRFAADDPARADMDVIVSESTRLERLVETLLRYARPLTLNLQDTELQALLQQSVRLIGPEQGAVTVEPGPEVRVAVDGEQLGQAILNILRNAVQASEGRGGVRARWIGTASSLRLEIDDSGPGIPPELREQVFAPYFTTKATGTGIGLAVTRRIVEAHGGRVEIDALPQRGARVTIVLPRQRMT